MTERRLWNIGVRSTSPDDNFLAKSLTLGGWENKDIKEGLSMRRIVLLVFVFAFVGCKNLPKPDLVLQNVNVIDVRNGEVNRNRDVSILGNRIVDIVWHSMRLTSSGFDPIPILRMFHRKNSVIGRGERDSSRQTIAMVQSS